MQYCRTSAEDCQSKLFEMECLLKSVRKISKTLSVPQLQDELRNVNIFRYTWIKAMFYLTLASLLFLSGRFMTNSE